MSEPASETSVISALREFIQLESAGGTLLLGASVIALILANSPLAAWYVAFFDTTVAVQVGALVIDKPLFLWVNDGLMAVFFFLIGLELKREVLEGELSDKRNIILPGVGAIGSRLATIRKPKAR